MLTYNDALDLAVEIKTIVDRNFSSCGDTCYLGDDFDVFISHDIDREIVYSIVLDANKTIWHIPQDYFVDCLAQELVILSEQQAEKIERAELQRIQNAHYIAVVRSHIRPFPKGIE